MGVAVTAGLSGALALGAYAADWALALAVLLAQGLLVAGWYRTLDVPGATGGTVLAAATAVGVDLGLLLRDTSRPLAPATGVLGLAVVAALGHQLFRRGREGVTASLTATTTLLVLTVLTAQFLPSAQTEGGWALVAVAALAVAAAAPAELLVAPAWARTAVALLLGALTGGLLGALTRVAAGPGGALGFAGGACVAVAATLVRRVAVPDLRTAAALPLSLAAPVTYVLGRIVVG